MAPPSDAGTKSPTSRTSAKDPPSVEDRRHSDGPRKPTACAACRKLKIKCHMQGPTGPCTRCKRRGLACTVHRPLHMLLDDDLEWKRAVTRKLQQMEGTLEGLSQQSTSDSQFKRNIEKTTPQRPGISHNDVCEEVPTVPLDVSLISSHEDMTMDLETGPEKIPSSSLNGTEIQNGGSPRGGRGQYRAGDIVVDGIVTEDQAKELFNDYSQRLDHYLYRILGPLATFDGIRYSSPILLSGICTVAALHSVNLEYLYEPCYRRFANLAANLALAEDANLNDIRSLCIGAFWLHKLSWNLSSLAVRVATQMHLHRAFQTALKGDDLYFSQTRLYYLVYVCDHHFSIAYGRPPLTRDYEEIVRAKEILSLPQATEDDARLVSQVELWSITSRVSETFGFDVDLSPSPSLISRMRRFAIEYDTWRADWNDRFGRHVHVGNYPRKGVKLHVNFAQLYLCSHAFRGLKSGSLPSREPPLLWDGGSPHSQSPRMLPANEDSIDDEMDGKLSSDLEDMAKVAIHSAQSLLETMVSDTEIQAHLNGLPLYFNTMMAFAVVFSFKIAMKFSSVTTIDVEKTLRLVSNVASTLKLVTTKMSARHLLTTVSRAIDKLLSKQAQTSERAVKSVPSNAQTFTTAELPCWPDPKPADTIDLSNLNWDVDTDFDWMAYDFLATDEILQPEAQENLQNQSQRFF